MFKQSTEKQEKRKRVNNQKTNNKMIDLSSNISIAILNVNWSEYTDKLVE